MLLATLLLLQGCDEKHESVQDLPVRPVLSMIVAPAAVSSAGFAGTVEARYQSDLAFRVIGRITVRNVKVGDRVVKGDVLAALDPAPLDFALRAARADVEAAKAQFENAAASELRRRTLRGQGNISAEVFDAALQAREAAQASLQKARTVLDKAQEQRGYAELRAEFDGIVTGVSIEVGQIASLGNKAITIAQPDIRDAVIDIPDDLAGALQVGQRFSIELQAGRAPLVEGAVREISPQVDALTHTRRIRIVLSGAPEAYRLGTLIIAKTTAPPQEATRIPLTAILERSGKHYVWVVDAATSTVGEREIVIADRDEQTAGIRSGIEFGMRIVTAGVHSLTAGRKVRTLDTVTR